MSGRQAQVSVRQTQDIVELDENGVEQVEPLEVGPVVDITPYIFAAGGPIRLKVNSTVTGFDGYQAGKPLIRTHNTQADLAVARGEALVIGGPNSVPGKGTDGPESRFVLTFLHAHAIDPAGNLIQP
jgi:type II secretory pathway component HofQ